MASRVARHAWTFAAVSGAALVGCGGCGGADHHRSGDYGWLGDETATTAPSAATTANSSAPSSAPAPSASVAKRPEGDPKVDAEIRGALDRVSKARGLPILSAVHGRRLNRTQLLANIEKKSHEELPPDVLRLEGETFRALELVPIDFDFEAGLKKLLQSEIAGYYDSSDKLMYLIDDLDDDAVGITLNHELIHALQDESFNLDPLTKYSAGHGDRDSAIQSLIEGDATNGMFDAAGVASIDKDPDKMAALFRQNMADSDTAKDAPVFIRDSLVAPYADGFRFVHALRIDKGWDGVNSAFHTLPKSTEQILHPEKYLAGEDPIAIDPPAFAALGEGYKAVVTDTMGESSFRFMFHALGESFEDASKEASGWGGDRYVLVSAPQADGSTAYALALHIRMDTEGAAKAFAHGLSLRVTSATSGCKERAGLGPIGWKRDGKDIALTAGPYTATSSGKHASAGTCAATGKWLSSILTL